MAFAQGIFAASVADSAGEKVRETAFGFYGLATGVALILSSILAGCLWDHYGAATTFYAGAVFSLLTLMGFQLLASRLKASV